MSDGLRSCGATCGLNPAASPFALANPSRPTLPLRGVCSHPLCALSPDRAGDRVLDATPAFPRRTMACYGLLWVYANTSAEPFRPRTENLFSRHNSLPETCLRRDFRFPGILTRHFLRSHAYLSWEGYRSRNRVLRINPFTPPLS